MGEGKRPVLREWLIAVLLVVSLGINIFLANDNILLRIPDKRPTGRIDIIWHGPEDEKKAALTFDDGPVPAYTLKILDALEKHKVHATFFVVGQYAEAHPDIIHRMIADGDEVENHTYSHPRLTRISTHQMRVQVHECHKVITKLTGIEPRFFRPPFEIYDARMIAALKSYPQYDICLWSIALEHHSVRTPQAMADRVIRAAQNGEIILAHDGRAMSNRTNTVAAIPFVIEGYQKKGYQWVTLRELFHLKAQPVKVAKGNGIHEKPE